MAPRTTTQDTATTPTPLMQKGEHNEFVNQMLAVAQALADERANIMERVDANRQILRNMATQGFLSDEQATAITEFYPNRPRKSKNGDTPDTATTDTPAAA